MNRLCDNFLKTQKYVDYCVVVSAGTAIFCSTIMVFVQVIFRYVLEDSLSWSEELLRYVLIWSVFLSTGYVLARGEHTCLDIGLATLAPKLRYHLECISVTLMFFFGGLLLRYGITYAQYGSRQKSSALQIPMSWIYIAIPIGGALIMYYCIIMYIKIRRDRSAQ
jgi:TRAP-type C4-dicarboxylate transport system, small permease component